MNSYSSSFYSINAGVKQGSVLALFLFLLNTIDQHLIQSNYADDSSPRDNFQLPKLPSSRELNNNRMRMCIRLSNDLEEIMNWEARNLVQFKATKTQLRSLSSKRSQNAHTVVTDDIVIENREKIGSM